MKITTNLFHKGEVMDFKSLYGQNVCEKTAKQRFDALKEKADALGVKIVGNKVLFIILGIVFPILPVNVGALALLQKNVNKLYEHEEVAEA